jgi:methyl-accepting chemotaxis protein
MTIRTRLITFFISGVIVTAVIVGIFIASEVLTFNTASIQGNQVTGILMVLGLVVATTVILWGVLRSINRPLAQITQGIEQISSGNLSPDLPEHVPGELGLISNSLITMCGQLRMVLNQLQTLSKHVVDSTSGAGESFVEIKNGVQIQSRTASRTFDAVGQMSEGLLDASHGIEDLAQRIEQSFSKISKMDSAISNVSETISGLSATIEQASQNTREGDSNVQTLANDVSDLSTQINTANDALAEMMDGFNTARADAGDAAFIMGSLENQTTRIGAAIEATIKGSNAINVTNKRILDVTESLQARVDRVDDVLETVHKLAERTKLLSINASIIASEAGEHGRAFAVVALEVKDLAGSTASAISEISQVVSGLKDGFAQTFETIQSGQREIDRGVRMARAFHSRRSVPGVGFEQQDRRANRASRGTRRAC